MSGLSFSLGGGDKKRPAAKFGFNLKVSQKPSKPLGAFQVDSDDEDKPDIPDAKKQKTEFKGCCHMHMFLYTTQLCKMSGTHSLTFP